MHITVQKLPRTLSTAAYRISQSQLCSAQTSEACMLQKSWRRSSTMPIWGTSYQKKKRKKKKLHPSIVVIPLARRLS